MLDPTTQPRQEPDGAVLGQSLPGPMISIGQSGLEPYGLNPPAGTRVGQGTGYPTALAVERHSAMRPDPAVTHLTWSAGGEFAGVGEVLADGDGVRDAIGREGGVRVALR
jgi:hypothetical protein